MIRFSGASVKVASTDNEKPAGTAVTSPAGTTDANSAQQASRKVTIVGTAEAQWKVLYKSFLSLFLNILISYICIYL